MLTLWCFGCTNNRVGRLPNVFSISSVLLCVFISLEPLANGKIDESKMEYIDNGVIKLGVNLALGGSITYIADSKTGKNVVNNWDWGRQVQMSFFAYPLPYVEEKTSQRNTGNILVESNPGQ